MCNLWGKHKEFPTNFPFPPKNQIQIYVISGEQRRNSHPMGIQFSMRMKVGDMICVVRGEITTNFPLIHV